MTRGAGPKDRGFRERRYLPMVWRADTNHSRKVLAPMKWYGSVDGRWSLLAWTAGAAALAASAAGASATPASMILVALFTTLMLLVQLRWQRASRRGAGDRERTLALLQETLDSTADGFLLLDLEGRVVSFNRRLTEMSGLSADAFHESNFEALQAWLLERVIDPGAFAASLEPFREPNDRELRDELRLIDGRIFERHTRPHRVAGRLAGRVWSFRDVTAERTALEALHRREQQLAQAQHIARVGSFDWNLRADTVDSSPELWRVVGYDPDSSWGLQRWMECVHPDDRPLVTRHLDQALAGGDPFEFDVRVVRPDQMVRYVAVSARVVTGPGGTRDRLIGAVQDVTERWAAAATLARRVRVESALTSASKLLSERGTEAVPEFLRLVGEGLGARRLFMLQPCGGVRPGSAPREEEWCAEGVSPALPLISACAAQAGSWWAHRLRQHGAVLITDPEHLPAEAGLEREVLAQLGASSTAAAAIRDGGRGVDGQLAAEFGGSYRASQEDLRALRTAGEMLAVHFAREAAEREIARRDAILEAVGFVAERFLLAGRWEQDVDSALERIGSAAGASRAYLFANHLGPDGTVRVSQRAEWAAEGIGSELDNPELQSVRLQDLGLGRWEEALRSNEPVQELVSELPADGRAHLESQRIRSVLLIPVFVEDAWWGFLGFDDCWTDRVWSSTEREVLMAAGRLLGAGIQRMRAEEALRESELRFTQLSDNIPEVFFMAPVDLSEVLYLSPAFEKVWGRPLADAYARPTLFLETVVPDDLARVLADIDLTRRGKGEPLRHFEYRIMRPDGTVRWIRNRIFEIPDEQGRPYRVAGVCTDVTDQMQLEEDLRRANRIEAIGQLAAGIAHEINTPIQYVGDNLRFLDGSFTDLGEVIAAYRALAEEAARGPVSLDRLRMADDAAARADLDYLLREAPRASAQALDGVQRVAEIVRAMKEFSHPGSGVKVPTDLNQAIRSTITVARNEWKYVAELKMELDETLPPVHCLPGELNQAILNLVINAAHAIADRQRDEASDEPGTIVVSTQRADDGVVIRVSDSGAGIRPEIRARIFDPFFTTKEVGRGTGQGLTFVHTIITDKHGGSITFDSEVGVGTTFIVRLPDSLGGIAMGEAA